MGPSTPWATGFLCNILICYLEKHHPALERRIEYDRILAAGGPPWDRSPDSKALIRDPNRWLPQVILGELVRAAERSTRKTDLAYRATIDYFASRPQPFPSVFELIAEMIDDMELTLALAGYWAAGYSNYLRLQTCLPSVPSRREAVVLCRFEDSVRPLPANGQFVRGHLEGFPKLYPFVERCRCEEEFSQLRLEDLARGFDGYRAEVSEGAIILRRADSGQKVIEAEAILLEEEDLLNPPLARFGVAPATIVPPLADRVRVLSPRPRQPARPFGQGHAPANRAYRVSRGGVLETEGSRLALRAGELFNAPYSRFRLTWEERDPEGASDPESRMPMHRAAHLLNHLHAMKEHQVRLLQFTAENRGLVEENRELRGAVEEGHRFDRLIGKSRPMQELYSLLRTLSELDTTVLILGETGTGKELVARAIHKNSPRRNRRFVAINCGALTETLLDSELFGYERGAFTGAVARHEGKFEQADGGTLFLDEIGEIPPAMQVKLLRVLEEGEFQRIGGREEVKVDVRVIAATHQELKALVEKGRFRKDLYYRLHVVEVSPPPLRERRDDIPVLAGEFFEKLRARLRKPVKGLSAEAMDCLTAYSWPGNVRELMHVIERAIIMSRPDTWIGPDAFPPEVRTSSSPAVALRGTGLLEWMDRIEWELYSRSLEEEGSLSNLIRAIEARIVCKAVREHAGNKTKAARALRRSYRWLRKVEKQTGP